MIRAGVPEKQIMLIALWKTRSLFDRYHIVDERDIVAAGQKMARYQEERGKVSSTVSSTSDSIGIFWSYEEAYSSMT